MANGWFLGGGLGLLIAGLVLFGIGQAASANTGGFADNLAMAIGISYIGVALGIPGLILAIAGIVWPEEKKEGRA